MTASRDSSADVQARVADAVEGRTPLVIIGGGTKHFLGREMLGEPLVLTGHCGVVDYYPEELVLTARSGTPVAELEALLAEHDQMFAFEPPHLGAGATLGGTIAANLSGPRRPYAGAARDFVLGVRIVNGRGEIIRFGGEVMKNVAGYDLSRLMAGAMGTLGVILDVSLKVLPRPSEEVTLVQPLALRDAIETLCRWAARPLPISASCIENGRLYVRLSGTSSALAKARPIIGGDELPDADSFWQDVREQRRPFFGGDSPLWRMSLPPTALPELPGEQLIEWGGALRWLRSGAQAASIRAAAAEHGGHAMLFRAPERADAPYHPLPEPLMRLHKRIKDAMDPQHIFNRGRMYPEL
ncbi:MAG TPA: glycolate oxidase subunit GlcE [Gammaproteobacteria bacterium]|nr:glycolate oxidase subunit GlcE [Gammaproteobacteria bacterium]